VQVPLRARKHKVSKAFLAGQPSSGCNEQTKGTQHVSKHALAMEIETGRPGAAPPPAAPAAAAAAIEAGLWRVYR
jgi:hypothetical protein